MTANKHDTAPLIVDEKSRYLIEQVRVKNYKSIGECVIELSPLTLIVGRNGAGKSNFLDALRFVADGLQYSLDHAMKSRGGVDEVRRRSTGHPHNFAIGLKWSLPEFRKLEYDFEIAARSGGGFVVKRERLRILDFSGTSLAWYDVSEGMVTGSAGTLPAPAQDRLYLVAASGLKQFREAFDILSSMGFYNLNPGIMKELQSPDAGELLHGDGGNLASVIARLASERPEVIDRLKDYLKVIVPDIRGFERAQLGPRETLEFRQEVKGARHPWRFYAASMSDGTLRAIGALVAVMQWANRDRPARLVGIEEPETALHPAAAGALMEALSEAAASTQVIVTTHSPDLLDNLNLDDQSLLVAEVREGTTVIARPDDASYEAIKEHLYTAGDLLRMDQLEPSQKHLQAQHQQLMLDFQSRQEEGLT